MTNIRNLIIKILEKESPLCLDDLISKIEKQLYSEFKINPDITFIKNKIE